MVLIPLFTSGTSDSTSSFQAAIDAAAQLPLRNLTDLVGVGPFGAYPSISDLEQPKFRAIVKIPPGQYLLDGILLVPSERSRAMLSARSSVPALKEGERAWKIVC